MKRFWGLGVLALALSFTVGADSLEDWASTRAETKVADLTVGDLKALAEAQSVERQERRYVHGAAVSSFLVPGLGQFKTGDAVGGTLNLAGHIALVGGTLYGAWALLPSDLQDLDLSHGARKDLMRNYWLHEPGKVAASAGVMVGGMTVALVHRFWAASDAGEKAEANLASGKVTFEPDLGWGHFGLKARF